MTGAPGTEPGRSLLEKLLGIVADTGPMPFDSFMRACLYDAEHGFFSTGPLRSVDSGDFLTSPEVSPWFGRILGRFATAEIARIDVSRPVVADVGAGSGSLLAALTAELHQPCHAWAIEASPAAREELRRHGDWRVAADVSALPDAFTGVVVANELIDNIPTALAVRSGRTWEERWVGAGDDGGLALVAAEPRAEVASWADRFAGSVPDGGLVEVQLEAAEWMRTILARLEDGALAIIDYGGTAEELEPRRTRGTLRTYRAHHLGPDPLLEPGQTDLTADVNFSALLTVAEESAATVELHRQDDFLRGWGLGDEVARLRREELELARGEDAMARLVIRSERTAAETLLHPRGLGDFRVLIARK